MTDTVVFTFGRFNPPTTGHEKLIEKVASVASQNGADFFIFPSQSNSPTKDPLEFGVKVDFMKKMFPKYTKNIIKNTRAKTAINVATILYESGYKKCIMVVGGDRVSEFKSLLGKYNGVHAKHGFFDFEGGVQIVSAGERDPDAEGVSGMSASKMRAAASANDYASFKNGLPRNFEKVYGKKLFDTLRKSMMLEGTAFEQFANSRILEFREFMDSELSVYSEIIDESIFTEYMLEMMLETEEVKISALQKSNIPEYMKEAVYSGNIGVMELAKFYQKATPEEKKKLQTLIASKKSKEAWELVQKKLGVKLIGKEFHEEGPFEITQKVAKSLVKNDDEEYVRKMKAKKVKEEIEELDTPSTEYLSEADYKGKDVSLNKPFRTPGGPKKFAVYVKNSDGNVVIVRFGDPNMEIKRDDPERRKSFRARHDCANAKDKTTPRYWSCYQWRAGAKVEEETDFKMTKSMKKKRDKLVDKMPDSEFKDRYGSDWKSVKYATATNILKKQAGFSTEEYLNVVKEYLDEEMDADKLVKVAILGLLDIDEIQTLRATLKTIDDGKILMPRHREILVKLFSKLADMATNDPQVYMKLKKMAYTSEDIEFTEEIRKVDGKYVIFSKDGSKKLGTYNTEKAAKDRLRQIEFFKHMKENQNSTPTDREDGTNSLVNVYKNSTPFMKIIKNTNEYKKIQDKYFKKHRGQNEK